MMWKKVCEAKDILSNGGGCVKVEDQHIAIFNLKGGTEWFAVQNVCPHMNESVLSRGIVGDEKGEPKVACPLHKNSFSLKTGKHLGEDESFDLKTYEIKVENSDVYLKL